jgi:hypothetical protein
MHSFQRFGSNQIIDRARWALCSRQKVLFSCLNGLLPEEELAHGVHANLCKQDGRLDRRLGGPELATVS